MVNKISKNLVTVIVINEKGCTMAKIYNFPTDWGKHSTEELFIMFANDAICASTNETLIDGEDIEARLAELSKKDCAENRSWLIMGLLFFNDVIIVGDEDTWTNNKISYNGSNGFAVYTSVEKLPNNKKNFKCYFELAFRIILEKLADESSDVDIYVNPGDKNGWTFSLALLRMSLDIANKAIDFADGLMKEGLSADRLTVKLFERFDLRNVEITLANGSKLCGEVTALSYGDEPDANYEITKENGERVTVYRADIAFIKEV